MFRLALVCCLLASAVHAQPQQASTPPLTAAGWGELKVGMREAAAVRQFKLTVPADDGVNSFDCRELTFPEGGPDLFVMTERGRVTRLTVYGAGSLRTDRGFGVGSGATEIKAAYGRRLEVAPHAYVDRPAEYLTYWTAPGRFGVRYETDEHGTVTAVHVGRSINYVEGCL